MVMRTTDDIDEDLHAEAQSAARRSQTSVSGIFNEALRKALRPVGPVERDPLTGFGVVDLGYEVSADDMADVLDD